MSVRNMYKFDDSEFPFTAMSMQSFDDSEFPRFLQTNNDPYSYSESSIWYQSSESSYQPIVPPKKKKVTVPVYSYQKVETYNPRYYSTGLKHKPTAFSVRLNNTHINELTQDDTDTEEAHKTKELLAASLKKDIANTVRDIAKNIAPANTQLFEVYFNDD